MMMAAADAAMAIQRKCDQVCPDGGQCKTMCDGCLTGLNALYFAYAKRLDQMN